MVMWALQFVRFEPLDPPAYVLFYTVILVIVMGTGAYLAVRKKLNRKSVQLS
jgi:hypothetical protein